MRSRINEHPSLFSEGSSRTEVREWMAFSLSTDPFFSLPCGTSMVCTPGHFPEGRKEPRGAQDWGNPGRPSKRTPRGGLYFTPYHPDPGTDGGRQPLLELRPLTGSLLIHRVLWNPHQSVSFAQSRLTPCNPVDCNPPGGLPQNNSSKSQHNINCTYPSSWVELNLSTKLKHSQNFFPPGLPQWWEFPL